MYIRKQILFCLTLLLFVSTTYGVKTFADNQKKLWKNTKLRVIPVNYRTDGFSQYSYKTFIPTQKGIEKQLVDPLAKGGISVIEWGTNAGTTVTIDSDIEPIVGSSLTQQEWKQMRKLDYLIYTNLKTMINSGNDPLKVAISRAHELGIKIFGRMEMNKAYGRVKKKSWIRTLLSGKFVKEHPEYRIPGRLQLDFKYKAVRDYKLALLRELAEKGCDGIMADFVCHPIYFADLEQGRPIMTQFIRDIRKMLDEVGAKQKRKIDLFVRVNYKDSYQRGLDWKVWMKEGLIDYISTFKGWPASDYFNYNIDEFVAYRDKIKSKCKVYGHIWQALGLIDTDPRPNSKRRYSKPKTIGMYIAQAALHNLSGADGLELGFASPQQWRDYFGALGTPEKIEFADKHYMVDIKPYLPLVFSPGEKEIIKKVKLRVADNAAKAEKLGLKVHVKIMLTGSPLSSGAELLISINGKGELKLKASSGSQKNTYIDSKEIAANSSHTSAHLKTFLNDPNWYKRGLTEITFPAEWLNCGENEIKFSYTGKAVKNSKPLEIRWIELIVEYSPKQGISADMAKGKGLTVNIADVSSEYRNRNEGSYLAEKLIGGKKSGLHYKGRKNTHSIVSDNFYRTGKKGTMWMATTLDTKNYIIFDLTKNLYLGYIKIWNWNNPKTINRGAKDIDVYVSAEKLAFGDKKWELCSHTTLSKAPGKHTVPFGDKVIINKKNVRYVLLHIKSTYGMKPAGLGEVAFFPGKNKTKAQSSNLEQLKELFTGKVVVNRADLKAYTGPIAVNAIVGKWRKKAYMANYNQLAINYGNNVDFQLRKKQIILCPQTANYLYSKKMVPRPAYRKGSHPELEEKLKQIIAGSKTTQEKVLAIMRFCRDLKNKPTKKWGEGFIFGGTEMQLIDKGEDLCEVLGRLFVGMCEIAEIPARIVMHDIGGHITAEAYINGQWGFVDPKTGVYFLKENGSIASVWDIMLNPLIMNQQSAKVKADLHPKYKWNRRIGKCRAKYFNVKEVNGFEYYSLANTKRYNYQQLSWEAIHKAGFSVANKKYAMTIKNVFKAKNKLNQAK